MRSYVNSLFHFEHRYAKQHLASLKPDDLASIWAVYKKPASDNDYRKALNMLAFLDGEALRKKLHRSISDPKKTPNQRIAAINTLNDLANVKSEKYYLAALTARGVSIGERLKLLQGLSKFGTRLSLPEVKKLRKKAEFKQMAEFSELMISSRENLAHKLTFHTDFMLEPEMKDFLTEKKVGKSKEGIALDDSFGLTLEGSGQEFVCGRSRLTMLMSEKYLINDGKSPQLVGVIGSRPIEGGSALTKMVVILDQARKGERKILVFRKDGLLSYAGTYRKDGEFDLHCTRRFASDLASLKGNYVRNQLVFSHFTVAGQMKNKQRPLELAD